MKARTYSLVSIVAAASLASAQQSKHSPAAAAPRIAGIAPAPAPPVQHSYPHRAYGHGGFRSDLPILLLADGRVFADFGIGFEQIVRSCALPSGYSSSQIVSPSGLQQPVVVQPTVTQPSAPGIERLPYTPPVPNQQTPSPQIAAQAGRLPQQSLAAQSCWAVAQNGRIVVAQP